MTGLGMHIGLKGLLSSRSALDVIGHNLSNSSTPGYSRQGLSISAGRPLQLNGLGFGTGVDSDRVGRTVDDLLQKRIVTQIGRMARIDGRLDTLKQIESLLGEPSTSGVQARMEGFFTSIAQLASSPGDVVLRSGMAQTGQGLAARINELGASLGDLDGDTLAQAGVQAGRVNELTARISKLNKDIAQTEAAGIPANDPRDQRDLALKELGALVDVKTTEDGIGTMRVSVGGQLVVGSDRAYPIEAYVEDDGAVQVRLVGNDQPIKLRSGLLSGFTGLSRGTLVDVRSRLDQLAHELALEVNRAHTTGVPGTGPFKKLTGVNPVEDVDGDGDYDDVLLADAGLPFDVVDGALYVNVTSELDGSLRVQRIDIDADRTTVADFLQAVDSIDHLAAGLTEDGRVTISADGNYGFDFAPRLDRAPALAGTFGGLNASLGASGEGPYALAAGDTLDLTGAVGAFTISFQPTDFADITQATAAEVAAVINADPNTQANGMRAVVEGGAVFLQSTTPGPAAGFTVDGGTSLGAFGWSPATSVVGSDVAVDVAIGGTYTGSGSSVYTFRPRSDGTVGATPGLIVDVLDSGGRVVARLDVGDGYRPGTELQVADGVTVTFGFGDLSATENDAFSLDVVSDSDTTDVLVALGLNVFFEGSDAESLSVRAELLASPERIATSTTGASGDNGVLRALQALSTRRLDSLGGQALGGFWADVAGDVGYEVSSSQSALEAEAGLVASLEARREQISGVNIDEELVNMLEFEQAFQASSQFIQVVNSLNDDLLRLV